MPDSAMIPSDDECGDENTGPQLPAPQGAVQHAGDCLDAAAPVSALRAEMPGEDEVAAFSVSLVDVELSPEASLLRDGSGELAQLQPAQQPHSRARARDTDDGTRRHTRGRDGGSFGDPPPADAATVARNASIHAAVAEADQQPEQPAGWLSHVHEMVCPSDRVQRVARDVIGKHLDSFVVFEASDQVAVYTLLRARAHAHPHTHTRPPPHPPIATPIHTRHSHAPSHTLHAGPDLCHRPDAAPPRLSPSAARDALARARARDRRRAAALCVGRRARPPRRRLPAAARDAPARTGAGRDAQARRRHADDGARERRTTVREARERDAARVLSRHTHGVRPGRRLRGHRLHRRDRRRCRRHG